MSALSKRVGQIISLLLIAIAAAGYLAAILLPWSIDVTSYDNTNCVATTVTSWRRQVVACQSCGILQSFCGSDQDWTTECLSATDGSVQGKDYCLHRYYVWAATFGLNVVVLVLLGIAFILYIVHIVGFIKTNSTLGVVAVSLFIAVIVLIIFSAGLPPATNRDANDRADRDPNTQCTEGPCRDFIGTLTFTGGNRRWGPTSGWIVFLASTIFTLIVLIVIALIGRRGDRKSKNKC